MLAQHFHFFEQLFAQPVFGLTIGHLVQLNLQLLGHGLRCLLQPFLRSDQLLARRDEHFFDLVHGPLIGWIKGPNRIDFVVKQLHPVSRGSGQRIKVDDSSAQAHLAAGFHPLDPLVTQLDHLGEEMLQL
ncbi:hypothetical protein D3C81_908090 [compost metagenome]